MTAPTINDLYLDKAWTKIQDLLQIPVFKSRADLQRDADFDLLPYALMMAVEGSDNLFSLDVWGSLSDVHLADESLRNLNSGLYERVGEVIVSEGLLDSFPNYKESWRLGITYRIHGEKYLPLDNQRVMRSAQTALGTAGLRKRL